MNLPKITRILFLGLSILFAAGYQLIEAPVLSEKSFSNNIVKHIYILKPYINGELFANTNVSESYPDVFEPFTQKHFFIQSYYLNNIFEKLDMGKNNFSYLTYANKRISELLHLGNDLPVLENSPTVSQLMSWWNSNKPGLMDYSKLNTFNSWEAGLSRYVFLMEAEVNDLTKYSKDYYFNQIFILRGYLTKHRNRLLETIYISQKTPEEKDYLIKLTNNIFQYLEEKINKTVPEYNPLTLQYSLKNVIQDKEYGTYDIKINLQPESKYLFDKAMLQMNGKVIPSTSSQKNEKLFNNVMIDTSSKSLRMDFPDVSSSIQIGQWTSSQDQDGSYIYILPVTLLKNQNSYFMVFTSSVSQSILIQFQEIHPNQPELSKAYLSQPVPPTKDPYLTEYLINAKYDPAFVNRITVSSQTEIPSDELAKTHIKLNPVLDPEIILEKQNRLSNHPFSINLTKQNSNSYLIDISNSTKTEDSLITNALGIPWATSIIPKGADHYIIKATYLPHLLTLVLSLIFFLFFGLSFLVQEYKKQFRFSLSISYFSKLHSEKYDKFLWQVISFIRIPLLIATICLLVLYIKFEKNNSDAYILWLVILWTLTTIFFKFRHVYTLVIGLLFFALASVLYLFMNELLSERIFGLSYLVFLIGGLQLIVQENIKYFHLQNSHLNIRILTKMQQLFKKSVQFFHK